MNDILSKKVLVLNQSYEPLMIIGAKRAICLVSTNKSECVQNYNDIVKSQSLMINIPSVIRVNRYVNFFRNNTILNRVNVLIRDDYMSILLKNQTIWL